MTYYNISITYGPKCEQVGKSVETYIKSNGGKVLPSPFIMPPVILCEIPDEMVERIRSEFKGIGEIKNGDTGSVV